MAASRAFSSQMISSGGSENAERRGHTLLPDIGADAADALASRLRAEGRRVIRVLGQDASYDLLRASGFTPVRLVARPEMETPRADALVGTATLPKRGRSLLEQIVRDESGDPLLITHADSELPQIFAALRALLAEGEMAPRPVHFLDFLHLPRGSSRAYNEKRLARLTTWLAQLGGASAMQEADCAQARSALLAEARALREAAAPQVSGGEMLRLIAAAHMLPGMEWRAMAEAFLAEARGRAPLGGERLVLFGSPRLDAGLHDALADRGFHIVADEQDWGDPLLAPPPADPADPAHRRPAFLTSARDRAAAILARARLLGATHALCVTEPEDEAAAWDAEIQLQALREAGIVASRLRMGKDDIETLFAPADSIPPTAAEQPQQGQGQEDARPRKPAVRADGQRSRKALQSVAAFGSYQRDWFAGVRQDVAAGAPFAVVNANSPQEMLRALGIPFVVNQWWASIAAAKQQSPRYFDLLRAHGYPADVEAYSAQGLAAAFDEDAEQAPWGGLPRPDFVQAVLGTDATPRIYDHWAHETGADLFLFERTVDPRLDINADWWDRLPDHWDEELEAERLDLMTAELRAAIAAMEEKSGRRFDAEAFARIMDLVNEQEEYYLKTRDLIARSTPVPVGIADTMPATMVPQWHRGTQWARDAARAFYEEVKARVEAGEAACPDERLRLMWIGRGMWSDMGFYQRWQESHGAVFIWSMYLSLAADGYIRRFDGGRDPLRALAARFITMGDELRMPTWAGAWHVREARTHGIDAAVALSDADPFVLRALERAGIPVLALDLDNYNREDSDAEAIDRRIRAFLEGPASDHAARRR